VGEQAKMSLSIHSSKEFGCCTIGYSKTDIPTFIAKLKGANLKTVVDVRDNPHGSIRRPDFNQEALKHALKKEAGTTTPPI
jgi:hypothetical protein